MTIYKFIVDLPNLKMLIVQFAILNYQRETVKSFGSFSCILIHDQIPSWNAHV